MLYGGSHWKFLARGALKSDRERLFFYPASYDGQDSPPLLRSFLEPQRCRQLIFSVFKTLTDQTVIVELKNDLLITGVLKSVDQSVS